MCAGMQIFAVTLFCWCFAPIAEASWGSSVYSSEVPCCRTADGHPTRHHHSDHLKEFSCGKAPLYYRTMYLDTQQDALYIGAMDRIYKLRAKDIGNSSCKEVLKMEPNDVGKCVAKGKQEDFECRNHIKVIQSMGDGHRLYVCGTNAYAPKDYIIYTNLTLLSRNEPSPIIGSGVCKCPYDPVDNSTAIWVIDGNPEELPALYSGTNGEFTKADPVIFRTELYDKEGKKHDYLRTVKYDSKWLDKTNFVGSFDSEHYVFFFFRETAVEYMNCGKAVYSRIARVCKKDTGGNKHVLHRNWSTYLKARLNCSIPGEFPFYFNEIQSVYQIPEDRSKFYAVFTTGSNDGLVGSAICAFSISEIDKTFSGRYKEQSTGSSAWLPVATNKVPDPRPGTCVENTQKSPIDTLSFIRSHSLMDEAVRHDFDTPVFYKRDIIFTQLVVDRKYINKFNYNIFYAGTIDGQIYKIAQWVEKGSFSQWNIVDIWKVTPGEPIRALQISQRHSSLYISTDKRVKQLHLDAFCKGYDTCVRCILDPYCGWDKDTHNCKKYSGPALLQDVTNINENLCYDSIVDKTLEIFPGQSLHLNVYSKIPDAFREQSLTWHHVPTSGGKHKIEYDVDRIVETSEKGIVILSVHKSDAGRYECYLGSRLIAAYKVNVIDTGCTLPTKPQEYKKIYTEWCREFERYKYAMRNWEESQKICKKQKKNYESNDILPNLR